MSFLENGLHGHMEKFRYYSREFHFINHIIQAIFVEKNDLYQSLFYIEVFSLGFPGLINILDTANLQNIAFEAKKGFFFFRFIR